MLKILQKIPTGKLIVLQNFTQSSYKTTTKNKTLDIHLLKDKNLLFFVAFSPRIEF